MIAVELKALAATSQAAALHYHDHPEQITKPVIVELFSTIARLAWLTERLAPLSSREMSSKAANISSTASSEASMFETSSPSSQARWRSIRLVT